MQDFSLGRFKAEQSTFTAKPDTHSHRDRLRARFLSSGPDSLPDYELLELLLFSAIPLRNTKPIAKALIKRFRSFGEVISASPEDLNDIDGIGESAAMTLKAVQAAAQRLLQTKVKAGPVISTWNDLISYCTGQMAYEPIEQFRVLNLDRKSKLIVDETQQERTVGHTPVYPREVVKRGSYMPAPSSRATVTPAVTPSPPAPTLR